MNKPVMLKKLAPITLTVVGVLLCCPLKANATPNLQIKPISWDIIGLDSNKPDIEGPNVFNIGARVCNLGTSAAKDIQAKINLGSGTGSAYISLLGLNTLNINYLPAGGAGSTFHNIGNTGATPAYCTDFYFNIQVQRLLAAQNTYREYYIEATGKDLSGTQLATITTPQPRRLYVEKLVEQNRNKVLTFTGTTTVQSGDIVDYTVTGQTATGGYEQLVFATNFPNTVFQVLKVNTNYTTPSGTTNNSIYGDACGWDSDPNSSYYRTCDNLSISDGYTGGKVGDDFTARYKVKIIATQNQTIGVSSLVYDKSGSSYHYNTTYKIPPDYDININVTPAVTADLSLTKTVNKLLPNVGENVTFTINVKNDGPDNATNVKVQDILPTGITYVSSNASVTFGATTPTYLSVSDYNGGVYISSTGMWDIGTLPKGATATLQIVATVNTTNAITNIAEVNASDQTDPDSTPNNNNVNEDDRAAVTFNQRVSISGTVFEDVNYGGGVGRDYTTANNSAALSGFATGVIRRPNVRVELYSSAGNFLTSTLTDTNGAYSFTNQPGNTSYTVRVVNGTVTSARPSSGGTLIPVQTYRTDATTGTITAVADRVGGENPTLVDAGNGSTTLAALTTATTAAQSIAQINAGAGNITGIDFGFNFDTIVSTRDSGQGSLRQFIINSNTLNNTSLAQVGVLSGREESIFMISDGAAHPGLRAGLPNQFSGGVATITLATALPAIANATSTNANRTSIDGRTQTALTGDTNAPIFNNTTGPEIVLNVAAGPGLEVQASFTFIKNIGITGANGVGTAGVGVYFNGAGAANSRLEDATIFSNDNSGVKFQSATSAYVNSNIIRNNGVTDPLADGVELIGSSSNNVTENIIINNPGYGIDLHTTTNNSNNLSSNQIINNGAPDDTQDAGIGIRLGSNNLIGQNTIANNLGDGIVVAAGTGNTMTENSIYSNGGLGIDLGGGSEGNGVTLNDSGDLDTGANGLFNFPILESAQLSGGNLVVKGFARPGSKIEFFVKQPDPSGFGEGQEYLVTLVEDSADDADATTGTYTSPFNGLNQGTDTTNRFEFSIPLGSLPNTVTTADTLTATATCLNSENCTSAPNGSTSEFSGNITITGSPHLSLVKRITAINGVPFSGFDGTATDPNNNGDLDEDVNWGLPLDDSLRGQIDGGFVQPGEEVEYTIYYLSTGATTAQNVLFCDRVPANMSFLATGFDSYPVQASGGLQGVARGILWQYNGTTESLTNVSDGDTAMYFPPGVEPSSVYPSVNCQGSNTTGAIVVNLGDLINATAPGIPANAYGFVRFKAKLN